MRFVRVPPYESWANWTNFLSYWENGNFLGVKTFVPSSTLKMRKSHKKLARVYAYTHAYTQIHDGGGKSAPPPPKSNRVKVFWVLASVSAHSLSQSEDVIAHTHLYVLAGM